MHPDDPVRDAARRPVHDAGDLLRGDGGVHEHRAGGRLSRRRPSRGDLRRRAARRDRGARAEDGPGRAAAEELHHAVPVPDAGRAAVRHRRLRRDAHRGAEARRRRGLRGAEEGLRGARASCAGCGYACYIEACGIAPSAVAGVARRARGPVRGRRSARAPDRQGDGVHRFAQLTARATRPRSRRSSPRASASRSRTSTSCTATPVEDPVRHGHLRLALDRGRRHGNRQGDGQGGEQGQEDRRPPAGGRRERHRVQGRASSRSPAPTRRRRSRRSRSPPTCRTTIRTTSSSRA